MPTKDSDSPPVLILSESTENTPDTGAIAQEFPARSQTVKGHGDQVAAPVSLVPQFTGRKELLLTTRIMERGHSTSGTNFGSGDGIKETSEKREKPLVEILQFSQDPVYVSDTFDNDEDDEDSVIPPSPETIYRPRVGAASPTIHEIPDTEEENPAYVTCMETQEKRPESSRLTGDVQRRITFSQDGSQQSMPGTPTETRQSIAGFARYQMSPDKLLKRILHTTSDEGDAKKRRESLPEKSFFNVRSPRADDLGPARGKSYLPASPRTFLRDKLQSHLQQQHQLPLVTSSVTTLQDQSHELSFSPLTDTSGEQNSGRADDQDEDDNDWPLQLSETQDTQEIPFSQRQVFTQKPTTLRLTEPGSKDTLSSLKSFRAHVGSEHSGSQVDRLVAEERHPYSAKRTSTPLEEGSPGSSLRDFVKPRTHLGSISELHLSNTSTITPTSTPPPSSIFALVNQQHTQASLANKQNKVLVDSTASSSIFHQTSSSSGDSGNSLSLEISDSQLNVSNNASSLQESSFINNISDLHQSYPEPNADCSPNRQPEKELSGDGHSEGLKSGTPLLANVTNNNNSSSPPKKSISSVTKNLFSPEVGCGQSITSSHKRPHSDEELGRNVRPLQDFSMQTDSSFGEPTKDVSKPADNSDEYMNQSTLPVADQSIQTDSSFLESSERAKQKPSPEKPSDDDKLSQVLHCNCCHNRRDSALNSQSLRANVSGNTSEIGEVVKKSSKVPDGTALIVFRDTLHRYKDYLDATGITLKADLIQYVPHYAQALREDLLPSLARHAQVNHLDSLSSGELADISSSNPSSKSASTSSLQSSFASGSFSQPHQRPLSPRRHQQSLPWDQQAQLSTSTTSTSSSFVAPHGLENDSLFTRPYPADHAKPSANSKVAVPSSSDNSFPNDASVMLPDTKKTPTQARRKNNRRLKSPKKLMSPKKASPKDAPKLPSSSSTSSPEISVIARKPIAPALESLEDTDQFKAGMAVMARWTDLFFYSGDLIQVDENDRWEVLFLDGSKRWVPEVNILAEAQITKGQSVLATVSDGYDEPGIVQGRYLENDHCGFIVELDTGTTIRCKRIDVTLSSDQAACLLKKYPEHPVASLSLDNIMEGKRRRTPKSFSDGSPVGSGSSPVTRTRAKSTSRPDPLIDSSDCNTTAEALGRPSTSRIPRPKGPTSSKKQPTMGDPYHYPDHEELLQSPAFSRKCELAKASPRPRGRPRKINLQTEVSPTGDAPGSLPSQPDLFQGLYFLISCADRTSQPQANVSLSSSGSSLDELPCLVQFERDHVRLQLESGGGTVFESFEETQIKTVSKVKVFLISNTYLRTLKYIKCLAASIPCLSVDWVNSCCKTSQLLDYKSYTLPAGHSLIENRVLHMIPNNEALKDLNILLVSERNPDFVSFWAPVLLAAQAATVYRTIDTRNSGSVDVVVTDPSCPENILTRSRELHIAVVSSEWVIQCIITGRKLPYDGHEKFKFTHANT